MKKFNLQWNDRMLEAWEEWKEICFVGGCSPNAQRLLETEIYAAFKAKFEQIFKDNVDDFLFTIGNEAQEKAIAAISGTTFENPDKAKIQKALDYIEQFPQPLPECMIPLREILIGA